MSAELTAERRDADERTWALSVFLGKVSGKELDRIFATMTRDDLERMAEVIESYRADIALRDITP